MIPFFRFLPWILLAVAAGHGFTSYGQNKVQYETFHWRVVQTTHFDIHYYQGCDSLAAWTAANIEQIYDSTAERLGTRLHQRIPVVLHGTHAQFQQTNVIREALPEAVGGFTEIFKNRIVLPFDGSYASFRHVLNHEMVHAMVFDLFSGGGRGVGTAYRMSGLPMWFSEGIAEFGSIGWEIGSEFFLIDAVSNGRVPNPAMDFPGYLAYKGGQSFLAWLESTYGKGTVRKLLLELANGYGFETAFRRVTNTRLEEVGEIWLRELRSLYWPEIGQRRYAKSMAKALTDHRRDGSFYNATPAISPDGKKVAFLTDRGNWDALVVQDVGSEKVVRTIAESGQSGSHESFRPFRSAPSWSPDGKWIALVTLTGGRDVIRLLSVDASDKDRTLDPGFDAILSPAFSPDGKTLVFAAERDCIRDLWSMDIASGTVRQLTNGKAAEDHPSFSPSGRYVAFDSDLGDSAQDPVVLEKRDIHVLDTQNGSIRRITHSRWSSHSPAWGPNDSLLVFLSNRSGLDNVYLQSVLGKDSLRVITNMYAGVFHPSLSHNASDMAFSVFEGSGWDIYLLHDPLLGLRDVSSVPRTRYVQSVEDSTPFFPPVALQNLDSYGDTTGLDREHPESRDGHTGPEDSPAPSPGDDDGLFLEPREAKPRVHAPPDSAPVDTLKSTTPDSLKQQASPPPQTSTDSTTMRTDSVAADTAKPLQDTLELFGNVRPPFRDDGVLRSEPYRTRWSLDQAMAMAGFSNVNGLGGQGMLTLSDLMGDQEISFWFASAGGDIENINAFVSYGYLPWRTDLYGSAFHTYDESYETMEFRRWLVLHGYDTAGYVRDTLDQIGDVPYGERYWGTGLAAEYPFSTYSRIQLGLDLGWRERTYFTYDGRGNLKDDTVAAQVLNTVAFSGGWIFDNARWGIVGPVLGSRLSATGKVVPPGLLQDQIGYWQTDADLRHYFRFFKEFTLALRGSAGMSNAIDGYENPQAYLLGGDDWTINWHFRESPGDGSQQDVFFSDWVTPLRGFRYREFHGTRFLLGNAEFRYPFVRDLQFGWPIPLRISNLMGAVFLDGGGTWDDREFLQDTGIGWGWGMRLNLGIFVLRWSRAWGWSSLSGAGGHDRVYWSLGAEF